MANYVNFVHDFPSRCRGLLERYHGDSRIQGRDVTFMLSIASAGFIVPFERLKKQMEAEHQSNDREEHAQATKRFDKKTGGTFNTSTLFKDFSWKLHKMDGRNLRGNPKDWGLDSAKPLVPEKSCFTILKLIRNALCHGNIYTLSEKDDNEIEFLIFAAKGNSDSTELLLVPQNDFSLFLDRWFELIENINMPSHFYQSSDLDQDAA